MTEKDKLKKKVKKKLDVPNKAIDGDENRDIESKLGDFLVEENYIKEITEREKDWGFVYYSAARQIAVSRKEMPHRKWEDCIFKMGINQKTGESLFPVPGEETEKYRFLHEANHAYQEHLCLKHFPENSELFYEKSLKKEIDCPYSQLFEFCFKKREEEEENNKKKFPRGLSIWGNASQYNHEGDPNIPNKVSEVAVRAQEDANELVTMFLWHPEYFATYLDYLSLNYRNNEIREKEITEEDLRERGLLRISKEEVAFLEEILKFYVKEMKKSLH